MKKILSAVLSLSILVGITHAQERVGSLRLKISEKSGFLGMGGARYINLNLSTKTRGTKLTSDLLAGSDLYYFELSSDRTWKMDNDFLKEEFPKLTIEQDGKTLHADFQGTIIPEGDSTVLLIGFKKDLQLQKVFVFQFPLGATTSTGEIRVPKELWPGYSNISRLLREADAAEASRNFAGTITKLDELLRDRSLMIFPEYETVKPRRVATFKQFYATNAAAFDSMLENSKIDIKQKISASKEYLTRFQYVTDNVADERLAITESDSSVADLLQSGRLTVNRVSFVWDSLQQALDERNTRWIVAGSSTGKIDFKYKYIIETLAHAFTSINFSDSGAQTLRIVIPEDLRNRLQKYFLSESYETFIRIVSNRWKRKEPMFPEDFVQNLRRDTAQFSLPYYSMLIAVNTFYQGDYEGATSAIADVMRKSSMFEFTERMDQLRIIIYTREKNIPIEALKHLNDGRKAEEDGATEKAIEHYKDAMLIAEDYAPAALALGKLYDRTGDSYTANNFFQKAIAADSQYYSAYHSLYKNYFKNASYKPMIELLTQAIASGNEYFDFYYYLGIACNGAADYTQAIQYYERALMLNDKSIDANIQAGISYQNMKSYPKAREYYTKAIALDPENQTATESLKLLDELQKKF